MRLSEDNKILTRCAVVLTIIGICFVLKVTSSVFIPFFCSLFLYILFVPIADLLDRAKVPRLISSITVIITIAIFLIVVYIIFSSIFNTISHIIPSYTKTLQNLDSWLAEYFSSNFGTEIFKPNSFINNFNIDWKITIAEWFTKVSNFIIFISKSLGLIFIYLFFLMFERGTFVQKVVKFYPEEKSRDISEIIHKIVHDIQRYLIIKTFISALTGVCVGILCYLMKFDLFLFSALLAFIFNFIPSIGSILVTFLISILSIPQFFPNFYPPLIIFVGITIIEMIIGNFIDPRISGNSLNISPFIILLSLSTCGYIWGIMGMFFSVMFVSIIRIVSSYIPSLRFLELLLSNPNKTLFYNNEKDIKNIRINNEDN